jgi:hypothetical protein
MSAAQDRLALKRMGMRGYAVLDAEGRWDGHLHLSTRAADKTCPPHGEVILVNTGGRLYRQREGQPIGPLVDPAAPRQHRGLDLRPAARRMLQRAAQLRQARPAGYAQPSPTDIPSRSHLCAG